jgi:hypothetical protein
MLEQDKHAIRAILLEECTCGGTDGQEVCFCLQQLLKKRCRPEILEEALEFAKSELAWNKHYYLVECPSDIKTVRGCLTSDKHMGCLTVRVRELNAEDGECYKGHVI